VTQEAAIRRLEVGSQAREIDPISKKPFTKKGWCSAQGIGPEFKCQYCKTTTKTM
jgi:hypothetical protein